MDSNWLFTKAGVHETHGMDTAETETFKKKTYISFAREILQNSIDARLSDEYPAVVEFKTFKIQTKNIPGVEELKNAFRRCKEFWHYKDNFVRSYENKLLLLEKDEVNCLRISDSNTTGLVGMESNKNEHNKFLAFIYGTGVSEKDGMLAGGSKGVGKFASFNLSELSTVYYSSICAKNLNGEESYNSCFVGVTHIATGFYKDDKEIPAEEREHTTGPGYYVDSNKNPLREWISLDPDYNRDSTSSGTDIYLMGFEPITSDWEKQIINSVLESFICAIYRKDLEVKVSDLHINKENLKDIVFNESIILDAYKKSIVSQFLLLEGGDSVKVFDFPCVFGNAVLYVRPMLDVYGGYATGKCSMIRTPLMKIKDFSIGSNYPVSSMFIIEKNTMGEKLREIENPEHEDWQIERIKDPNERKVIYELLKEIKKFVVDTSIACIKEDNDEPIDPFGAGDYLPDLNADDGTEEGESSNSKDTNETIPAKIKISTTTNPNASDSKDQAECLMPDVGTTDENEPGDVQYPPDGHNNVDTNELHGGGETGTKVSSEGDEEFLIRTKLGNVKYKFIVIDKDTGKYRIIFTSPITCEKAYLKVSKVSESNESNAIFIKNFVLNGNEISSTNPTVFGPFKLLADEKNKVDLTLDTREVFACKVEVSYENK